MSIEHQAIVSVEKAELVVTPWPHLALRDFLPWDYYAELLAHWPVEADWRELVYPDQRKPDGTYRRQQLMLTETDVLKELTNALCSTTLQAVLFERLGVSMEVRAWPQPILVDDEAGYWIRQHPDVQTKIVTLQVYLPEDDSTIEMGTDLVGPTVRTLDFSPNEGFVFHPTRSTIHQVPKDRCHHRRRSIQVIWYDSTTPNVSYFNKGGKKK